MASLTARIFLIAIIKTWVVMTKTACSWLLMAILRVFQEITRVQVVTSRDAVLSLLVAKTSISKTFKVSPNPFHDKLTIGLLSDTEKGVNFALIDVDGKTITQKTFNVLKGDNELILNIENFCPPGSYFLIATDESGKTDVCLMIKAN